MQKLLYLIVIRYFSLLGLLKIHNIAVLLCELFPLKLTCNN